MTERGKKIALLNMQLHLFRTVVTERGRNLILFQEQGMKYCIVSRQSSRKDDEIVEYIYIDSRPSSEIEDEIVEYAQLWYRFQDCSMF